MPTNLDSLIATEKGQEGALEKEISGGLAAQVKLSQVRALLADLSATRERRDAAIDGADTLFAKAKDAATKVSAKLAPVGAMLSEPTRAPTLKQLDDAVAEKLSKPPEPPAPPALAKEKYVDYVAALDAADAALSAANAAAVTARDAEAQAKVAINRAESALQAAVDRATALVAAATAALTEAVSARASDDVARAYWARARANALVDAVNSAAVAKAITDAEKALKDAADAYASAVSARIAAEVKIPKLSADRAKAAEQLGAASAQVLDRLIELSLHPPAPTPPGP